ncbi:insulinase family protein [Thermosulfurimonas marina]|uniref:Insulinase family protein n=1 Tax=Thermosulfurimonas marina TaxID=2047767 RepID=A0A6H1WSK0_9BACT|nr:pitrilysin family protein [Thermosulfurimonas marina]QJA06150.1 insulinase family protein [Thermosulfurimonas marina]
MGKALRSWWKVGLFLLGIILFQGRLMAQGSNLRTVVLENGLSAVVEENHRAPVVAVQVWVRAGSVYEDERLAGITHLIEHMIFKGTEKRGPGEIAEAIEAHGGYINAFTSYDYTCYYIVGPREILEIALDILSDAVFHATFDSQELAREKEVVLEEMRMREDRPMIVLAEEVMKRAYQRYPYRRPIIGYEKTVRAITRKDILDYVKRFYVPENMAVVVVGDVEASRTLSLIQKYFGGVSARKALQIKLPEEPYTEAPLGFAVKRPVEENYFEIVLPAPSLTEAEAPVMDVMAALLGEGRSSRLYLKLRQRLNLVSSVEASAFTPAGPGLFEVYGTAPAENLKAALKEALVEVFRLKYEPVPEAELRKARIQVLSDFVHSRETMEGEARKLGTFQMVAGDPRAAEKYLEAIRRVSPEDIRRAAQKYFDPQKVVAGLLSAEVDLTPQELAQLVKEAELEAQGVTVRELGPVVPPVFRILSNGLRVIIQPLRDVPSVGLALVFPGGLRYESPETNGLFRALTTVWPRATQKHSAEELAAEIEALGGRITGFSGRNTFGLEASFLSEGFEKGLKLFLEVLREPALSPQDLDRARPELLSALYRQEDQPLQVALREFYRVMFSPHPYGLNVLGSKDFFEKATAEDLRRAYARYVRPDAGVLAIVGDVEPEKVLSALEKALSDWEAPPEPLPEDQKPPALSGPRITTVTKPAEQAHLLLGFRTPGLSAEDRYALEVLNAVLAGQGGRLFRALRDKEALAYSVTSFLSLGVNTGALALYIGCAPDKKEAALSGLWREITRVKEGGISEEELSRAKNWLIGRYETELQTNLSQAMDRALNEALGLGFNYFYRYIENIRQVSAEEVQEAARKYLDDQHYVLVILTPAQAQ